MKYLILSLMMMNVAIATPKASDKSKKVISAPTAKTGEKAKEVLKDEEDCDDKAKKVVEIKPETISLGGNTGCTLEE